MVKKIKPFTQSDRTPKAEGAGSGWCRELDRAWSNGTYAVMARDFDSHMGKITHVFIRDAVSRPIGWAEKQQIKNMIFGEHLLAVEVYPPVADLVDQVNAYHLWILHDVKDYPFNLKS